MRLIKMLCAYAAISALLVTVFGEMRRRSVRATATATARLESANSFAVLVLRSAGQMFPPARRWTRITMVWFGSVTLSKRLAVRSTVVQTIAAIATMRMHVLRTDVKPVSV